MSATRAETEPRGLKIIAARKLPLAGKHAGAMRLGLLAEEVFGGPRPSHWWPRKLAREQVDASLSPVVVDTSMRRTDPRAILGYALVGVPRSLDLTARTAGIGVRSDSRGHGLGRALIQQVVLWARARGLRRLRSLAQPHNEAFYLSCGYHVVARRVTLQIDRSNAIVAPQQPSLLAELDQRATMESATMVRATQLERNTLHRSAPEFERWSADADKHLVRLFGWIDEAWDATCPALRRSQALLSGSIHVRVSDEGGSWLLHRLSAVPVFRELWPRALLDLRSTLDDPRPLLVYGIPHDAPGLATLLGAGCRVAQDFAVMEREI